MPSHRVAPRIAARPLALLSAGGQALLGPGRRWWPAALLATLASAASGSLPSVASFTVRTVVSTWLLAGISLVVAEHAAGGRLTTAVAWRTLRGRVGLLAGLGLTIRVVSDALTPVGIGLLLSAGWALAVPAAAVERLGFSDSLRASWQLGRPARLRLIAVRLSAVLLAGVAVAIVPHASDMLLPSGLEAALRPSVEAGARLMAQTLLGPFPLVVQALLYVEARGAPTRDFSVSIAETGVGSTPSARAR